MPDGASRGPLCRKPGNDALHPLSELRDVIQGHPPMANQETQPVVELPGVVFAYEGAALYAGANLDQPFLLQDPQRLPKRPAARTEHRSQLAFRRQPISRFEPTVE